MKNIPVVFLCFTISYAFSRHTAWPVIKHDEGKFIGKIAMPVGGIGTGRSLLMCFAEYC
ncbi:MAG TPA: hypothetical protein VGI38_01680 [Puia sp.]